MHPISRPCLRPSRRGCALAGLALAGASALAQTLPADDAGNARGRPLWEAGIVAGGGRVADYPGADQSHQRAIALPIVIYRGPVLRIDQSGIRGRLAQSSDWEFSLSATGSFDARDNDARRGMPALDYLFGVGPQWIYKGLQNLPGAPTLRLKARAMMSTDFSHIDRRGTSADAEVRWHLRSGLPAGSELTLSLQPGWASSALQRYLYQVEPAQAAPGRPAYRARGGYLGTDATATWALRLQPALEGFATVQLTSLHGAANAASPLLRDRTNVAIGAGVIWTPWRSSRLAGD